MKRLAAGVVMLITVGLAGCITPVGPPATTWNAYLVTDAIPYASISPVGATFFSRTLVVYYGQSAILSLSHDRSGEIMVDDVMSLDIRHPDGSTIWRMIDFTGGCSHAVSPLPPRDISAWLERGYNEITFTFSDQCGGMAGSTAIYLTTG